jgi:DnaJ-class molecular chaperone
MRDTVRFDVEVRRGIRKGNRMVIPQMGHQNKNGTFSDLVIVFDVTEHPRFVRKDNHLFTKLDISLRKALLGFKIGFEHIDGNKIVIRTEDIIQPGAVRKIPQLGLMDMESGAVGDLFIQFNVVFPSRLNSKQLKALDIVFHKDVEKEEEKIENVDISHYYSLQKTELGANGEPKKFYADIDDVTEDFSQTGLGGDPGPEGANIQCAQQ